MPPDLLNRRNNRKILALCLIAVAAAFAFMLINARGPWSFVLPFRGAKLAAMLVVANSIAVSTLLFQTITANRILTPSIMGFDALYGLIQTVLIFSIGSIRLAALSPTLIFLAECGLMIVFSWLLYRWLFSGNTKSLQVLLLVGIVFGMLFRSLSAFLHRVIDPNEFVVLQDRMFASFNNLDTTILASALLIAALSSLRLARSVRRFDVLALGRESAINLGIDYRRETTGILMVIAVLVSVSTALVGPVTFLGLLMVSVTRHLMMTEKHLLLLPSATLCAFVSLVAGQLVLEHVLHFDAALGMIIEFVGGLFFLTILIRKAAR